MLTFATSSSQNSLAFQSAKVYRKKLKTNFNDNFRCEREVTLNNYVVWQTRTTQQYCKSYARYADDRYRIFPEINDQLGLFVN